MSNEVGPEGISLATFEADAEKALDAASKLLTFATQYGSLIPGLSPYVGMAKTAEEIIQGALTLFKA